MQYPGRIIKQGETDALIVRALKIQLNLALAAVSDTDLRLDPTNQSFGPEKKKVAKIFQARNVDGPGRPLKQVAAHEEEEKVREIPKNSNRGPRVDEYLCRAGVDVGLSWCCAFVYWCFADAAENLGRPNPMVKTAGCLDHWNRALRNGARRVLARQAIQDPCLVASGMIFIIDRGDQTALDALNQPGVPEALAMVEGNTDASKTRKGGGVYRLTRKLSESIKGLLTTAAREARRSG